MRTPTGEIDLRAEGTVEESGSTDEFELYVELDDIIDLSEPHNPPETYSGLDDLDSAPTPNADALWQSDDVIPISGSLPRHLRGAGSALSICSDCGSSSDSDEVFCIRCGGPLEAQILNEAELAVNARACADCGETIESDEIFCPSCGSVIAE